MLVIGLTGMAGCGKSTVAKYIERKGFTHLIFSDMLKREAEKKNLLRGSSEEQKIILSRLGAQLRESTRNKGILADMLVREIENKGLRKVVVDGFRSMAEVEKFKRSFGSFYLIHVDAKPEIRFRRIAMNDKKIDDKTFFSRDRQDTDKLGLGDVIKSANFKIDNNVSLESTYAQTDLILKRITG
jgi:dephospho-CoA kinase